MNLMKKMSMTIWVLAMSWLTKVKEALGISMNGTEALFLEALEKHPERFELVSDVVRDYTLSYTDTPAKVFFERDSSRVFDTVYKPYAPWLKTSKGKAKLLKIFYRMVKEQELAEKIRKDTEFEILNKEILDSLENRRDYGG